MSSIEVFSVFIATIVGFALCGVSPLGADEAVKAKEIQLVAPALPSGARADWRQWDFSVPVTKRNQPVITVNATSVLASAYFVRASASLPPDSRYG